MRRCPECGVVLEFIESSSSVWWECPTHGMVDKVWLSSEDD